MANIPPSAVPPGRTDETADDLYELANRLAGQGRLGEAAQAYRRTIDRAPGAPEVHNNLANVLSALGRGDEALDHYDRALALGLDHPVVHYNRANLLKGLDRLDEAVAGYVRALELDPAYADAFNNLGNALRDLHHNEAAADAYLAALTARPDHPAAHSNLPPVLYLLHEAGQEAMARERVARWVELAPDNPLARHTAAALGQAGAPPRASEDYVRQTFDRFAEEFDARLTGLDYRAPALIAEALGAELPRAAGDLAILDAGCGTGLSGLGLRPYARTLIGLDLSPGMLARAAERGLYDRLEEADLTAWLAAPQCPVLDVIAAADVLCYFGQLDEIMARLAGALTPGGRLAFTLERADGDDVVLRPHGRYAHAENYVRRRLAAAGLAARRVSREIMRRESGRPVEGFLVLAVRDRG
ncbi:tetratricopeptide repeat protein [Azospirillum sp.]|uniref:tetratricopeptide repeat protein n=1 Tax=Azospirillum sp. TaxID=34012 RepID=UPI002D6A8571|nr:tetratricopeptide repeat protein [Azospirillum sp.]HYD70474.1 tetratricopeptide repeat protein [Azospirillum sp.]